MTQDELKTFLRNLVGTGYDSSGEIEFVKTDTQTIINNVTALYEQISGRTLSRADPVRLFLLTICYVIILQQNCINYTGKQNLLRYAVSGYLDEIGYLIGVSRLPAAAAKTTIKVTLSAPLAKATVIPAGVRISPDNSIFFATDSPLVIQAGDTEGIISATCMQTGEIGNDFLAGQINKIVDVQPYVKSMTNTTLSEGGSDIEGDDSFRERIHIAPESFSTAGPTGAYEYWAKSASVLISDVLINSPEPGTVNIYVLLQDGALPGDEILQQVLEICSDKRIRPLTDKVLALAPDVVNYDVDLTYYISSANASTAQQVQKNIEAAVDEWIVWTKSKIGRDINPSELIQRMVSAGAKRVEINSPAFTKILNGSYIAASNSVEAVQLAVSNDNPVKTFGGLEDD